ncbi:MAG: thioredoxin fold domain-containing protein [Burkholderiaceae bacterium]|nr:thioredoxin fold domain-containing protein [Burkholderiaceae bacterium]
MKMLTRRRFAILAGAVLSPAVALAADTALPVPASLKEASRLAGARKEPLVLLVSLPGCPYCELVRRNYLLPMRAEGLHAWQIDVTDRRHTVFDFQGRASSGAVLAAQFAATFTPTVLFFSAQGTELADRLVGVASADFYGGYLDDAISRARAALGAR